MAKTLAQKHADNALDEAVARVIDVYGLLPPGHSLTEFVVVMEGMGIAMEDEDGGMPESLSMCFRNGVCRTSTSIGLLTQAVDVLRSHITGRRFNDGEA